VGRVISRVGLISDTHGRLDPRVHQAFAGVDAIVHAGDVCGDAIIYELMTISPNVTAVLGNCDRGDDAWGLEPLAATTVDGVRFLAVHDIHAIGAHIPDDVDVVVHGHSHKPSSIWRGRVLLINPGSASQRRTMPSRSVAVVEIGDDASLEVRSIMLDDIGPALP